MRTDKTQNGRGDHHEVQLPSDTVEDYLQEHFDVASSGDMTWAPTMILPFSQVMPRPSAYPLWGSQLKVFTAGQFEPTRLLESTVPNGEDEKKRDTISRYELDAKMEAVEERIERRVQNVESSIDRLIDSNERLHKDIDRQYEGFKEESSKIDQFTRDNKRFLINLGATLVIAIIIVMSLMTAWMQFALNAVFRVLGAG